MAAAVRDCLFCVGQVIKITNIHCVSKNVPPLVFYNFDTRERLLIIFGRNVRDKVSNHKTLYRATSSNVCFCTI